MRYRGHLLIWELLLVLLFLVVKSEVFATDCPDGYMTLNPKGPCMDINECEDEGEELCGDHAECFNTKGSYYCQCEPGFKSTKGNVNFTAENSETCQDINECAVENINCGPHAKCHNYMGGYACMCTVGFKASSGKETFKVGQKVTCEDIDECTEEDCGPNATCQNNEGSYACICNAGFKKSSGKETCEKDMCTVKNCGPYATCQNIDGGYTCVCKDGFVTSNGNDTFLADQGVTCQDKDECVLNAAICGGNEKCHNTPGNYFCSCNPGFSLNNETGICEGECEADSTICGENAKCHNIPESHYCVCNPGFRLGSGKTNFTKKDGSCEDICSMDRSICGGGACQQGPGGYECICHKGYTNYGLNQEACTAFNCDDANPGQTLPELKDSHSLLNRLCMKLAGNDTAGASPPDGALDWPLDGKTLLMKFLSPIDGLLSKGPLGGDQVAVVLHLIERALRVLGPLLNQGSTTPTHMARRQQDGRELLLKLLSIIDGLLSKGPLHDSKQVTMLLSSVESALKLVGPLLSDRQTNFSTRCVELELRVERGAEAPSGPLRMFSGNAQLDTHWETATGAEFPGVTTVALLTYKNLEESTNNSFAVTPDDANTKFQMNSKVVTATVSNSNTTQLTKNITLSFSHFSSKQEQHKCVYWDHGRNAWSDRGCTVVTTNASHTVCSCNHLSSFAVLMALYEVEDTFELLLMTWVGLSLSLVCLLACVLTFAFCRSIQSTRNTIHLHLSLSLFVASLIFLVGISRTENQTGCAVVAGLLHFFYLSVFCWMCLEGVQLFRMVVLVFHTTLRTRYLMAAGYGVPALIVAISAMVYAKGYGSKRLCWFDVTKDNFIWSFLGPVCVIITANVFFFLLTVYKLAEKFASLNPDFNTLRKIKTFTITAVAQLAVLGLMWIFGCFQFNNSTMAMSYLFTFFNCLQGVLMFCMHCLLNKQVREEYGKFLSCICAPHKTKYSDFSSNQSKSQLSKSAQNTGESQI
ncbi:adhesion G protein-coupled receptor E5-like isoform X2 [Sardina pilchardus]|uniref:adhesion G protein-coupled receptor E5-like isoform X2 n=1 Tax=Sardina pilchardus TaxID=27697 RepID=UPI002E12E2A4